MNDLSPRLRRRIERDFPRADADAVAHDVAGASESERVRAAIVLAAHGSLDELGVQVDLAALDRRDVLVNGGVAGTDWEQVLVAELGRTEPGW